LFECRPKRPRVEPHHDFRKPPECFDRAAAHTPRAFQIAPLQVVKRGGRLNHRVQKFDSEGNVLAVFGGEDDDLFKSPLGLAVDGQGNIYVVDMGSKSLKKLDPDGNLIAEWSTDGGDLDQAAIVAVDSEDYLYVFANTALTNADGNPVNVILLKKFKQP